MTGSDLIEGIIVNGNKYLTKSLQRIGKLTSEIAQVEIDITRLLEEIELKREETDNELNNDGDAILAAECFTDDPPPSPPVPRRNNVDQSHFVTEEINACQSPVSHEALNSSSTLLRSSNRKSSVSPTVLSSPKSPSQEY